MKQLTGIRRFFFSAIFIIAIRFISFGQSSEVEPNNSFSTASPLEVNDPTTASLGGGDDIDFHGLDFNYNANFYLVLEITNTGSNGTQSLDLSIFNSLKINDEYVGVFSASSFIVDEGETFTTTINVCGLEADSFYLKFESLGDFDYTMEWYPANVYNKDDLYYLYNNTPGTASPFSFDTEEEASLGYEFWGSTNFDTVDYFTTTLPAANYDSVYLRIRAQNNQCGGTHWIKYFCYKNGSSTPFASGFVGDNPAVSSLQEVFSSIPLNNMLQGDNLLVKFVTNGTFGYRFEYKYLDIYEDDEDNCCVHNAIILNESQTKGGNVGEYDTNTEEFIDEYDTYRIVVPFHGSVKFFITARNDECTQQYYSLSADILDKYGNEVGYAELAYWDNYPACNTIFADSIKLRGFTADTFYLRLYDAYPGKISYTIRYETLDSTGNFDVEPNNTFATATLISPGEVKKGHVYFMETALYDTRDFYKGTMPAEGNIRVYLKTVFRGSYPSNDISLVTNGYFTHYPTPHLPETNLQPDSIYLDTIDICGIRPVSYTHLDVYKRQYKYYSFCLWQNILHRLYF